MTIEQFRNTRHYNSGLAAFEYDGTPTRVVISSGGKGSLSRDCEFGFFVGTDMRIFASLDDAEAALYFSIMDET